MGFVAFICKLEASRLGTGLMVKIVSELIISFFNSYSNLNLKAFQIE